MANNQHLNPHIMNPHIMNPVYPDYQQPRQPLTVSDIVKLATAGVKVDFNDIASQIVQDPLPPPPHHAFEGAPLADAIWERWHRSKHAGSDPYAGMLRPWQLFAAQHGDTVHVFVAPLDAEPFVLTDPAAIFPSDALMASLALHEKLKP